MNKMNLFFVILIMSVQALAVEMGIPVQLRLKSPTDTLPNESGIAIRLQVLSPSLCILREEIFSNQTITNGVVSLTLGTGGRGPNDPNITLNSIYNNSVVKTGLSCVNASGTVISTNATYTPTATDVRTLRFQATVAGDVLLADFPMRSVPWAIQSESAQTAVQFSGSVAGDISGIQSALSVDKIKGIPVSTTTPTSGQYLKFNGVSWTPDYLSASSGTVTDVSSANSYINVATGTSTPVLTLNVGTTAGTVAAGNDSRLSGAFQSSTILSGDLSGSLPSPTLSATGVSAGSYGSATNIGRFTVDNKGRISAASNTLIAIPSSQITQSSASIGQVLKWSGTAWTPASDDNTISSGTVSAVSSANSYITVANSTTTPSLTLNVGSTAGTVAAGNDSRITGAFQSSTALSGDLSGTLPNVSLGNTAVAAGSYGSATSVGRFTVDSKGRLTSAGNTAIALPPSQLTQASATTGQVLKWSGTAWAPAADDNTISTGTVSNVTSTNSYLTVATPSTTPALTLNVGNTSGTLAAGDDSRLTGAFQSSTALSGDLSGTLPNANLSNTSVTAGSYGLATSVGRFTVDSKGRLTSAGNTAIAIPASQITQSSATVGQVLKWNGSAWTASPDSDTNSGGTLTNVSSANSYLSVTSPTTTPVLTLNIGTGANTLAAGNDSRITGALQSSAFNSYVTSANCSTTETMYWNSVSGAFACQTIGTVANATTAVNFTGSLAGDISGTQAAISVDKIKGVPISTTAATAGTVLVHSGTEWVPKKGFPTFIKKTADQSSTVTAVANVTGLSFAVTAGVTYKYRFNVLYTSASVNTGLRIGITYPAATISSAIANIPGSTTDGTGFMFSGFISTSGDSVVSASSPATTPTVMMANIEGIFVPSASGTIQLQAASEVAGSAIVIKANSFVEVSEVP